MNDPSHLPKRKRAWKTDAEWQKLRARIDQSDGDSLTYVDPFTLPRSNWRRFAMAAAACVVVATGWYVRGRMRTVTPDRLQWTTVATVAGQRDTILLSDSTRVSLAPATTMRYALTATRREVQLDGMANFEVVHNAQRPFHVRIKNADVTDIGTEFGVRAYATDTVVRVSVTSGIVALRDTSVASKISALTLVAGKVGQVNGSGETSLAPNLNANANTAWQNGQLIFSNQPLDEVAVELSRWFGVKVRVANPTLAQRRVTAVYSAANLTDVLTALAATLDVTPERTGDTITIRPAKR